VSDARSDEDAPEVGEPPMHGSPPDGDAAGPEDPAASAGPAGAPSGRGAWRRALPPAIAGIWLVACVVVAVSLSAFDNLAYTGGLDGLVPQMHRLAPGEPLVLLEVDPQQLGPSRSPEEALLTAADAIANRMASERVPLAPPAAELTSWFDAHALYLLPRDAHGTLRTALSEPAIQDSVDGIRARLSSPMFGATGEQPRRDPLALARLSDGAGSLVGQLADDGSTGPRPTATGDLLAHNGLSLLIQLQATRALPALQKDVADALAGSPIDATVIGAAADEVTAIETISTHLGRLAVVTLAGLTLVLAVAVRSVRTVIAIVLCVASAIAAFTLLGPDIALLSVPMLVLLAGFGCEGALHLQRISERGWPAAAILGTALLPLSLSPYPIWTEWSWQWLVGVMLIVATLRGVLPSLVRLVGGMPTTNKRGFVLRPVRTLAVLLSVGALASGAWAVDQLSFRGFDQPLLNDTDPSAKVVRTQFFDRGRIVEAQTVGRTAEEAVTRAAGDARALAQLVPSFATRIDSPGGFVLPAAELDSRREALASMNLDESMDILFELLSTRGFRPDAFGEFLRSASDLENTPTPKAALEGPLGPWISRYLTEQDDVVVLRSLVHLRGEQGSIPEVERDEGPALQLQGPAIGARLDRETFGDWLGIYVAGQLWLGAVVVWLGTRSLAVSLGATVSALTAQTAVLAAMVPLRLPLGPEMIPVLLLVGAAGMVAGGRACRAIELRRPFFATGLLVTGLCQVVAGLALMSTGELSWVRTGLMIAIGAVAASGAGLFVAPGIAKLLWPKFGPPDTDPQSTATEDAP